MNQNQQPLWHKTIEANDPEDGVELIKWAQERLNKKDFPAALKTPWINITNSELFLTSTLRWTTMSDWLRSAALFLLRRFKEAYELAKKEGLLK